MKAKILILLSVLFLIGCNSNDEYNYEEISTVLMLKVDYSTNQFEGGTEFFFNKKTDSFTIDAKGISGGDAGNIQLLYKELNEPLFDGSYTWMGLGKMTFPKTLIPADKFDKVMTADYISPGKGFEEIFPIEDSEYANVWMAIQNLKIVREYLQKNPDQTVKLFLYTPSLGPGNPADHDWIIYLNK